MTISRLVDCVSTMGVSPVTVTVSWRPPMRISALIGITPDPGHLHALTLNRVEPGESEAEVVCPWWQISDAV